VSASCGSSWRRSTAIAAWEARSTRARKRCPTTKPTVARASALYARAETFARQRGANRITAAYFDRPEAAPTRDFLFHRGFVPFERYHPSHLDLTAFDPAAFADAIARLEQQGFRLFTYAEVGDSEDHRRRLYDLESATRSVQPFREIGDYAPPAFATWEADMAQWSQETIFLAAAPDGAWVGVITGLEWGFTGVHPDWQGRGIATALKVRSLAVAKAQGMEQMQTENHEDNAAMLAINRKLGFVMDPVEVNCVRRL
jgi:GNAT superfamily N-acetyltransferase